MSPLTNMDLRVKYTVFQYIFVSGLRVEAARHDLNEYVKRSAVIRNSAIVQKIICCSDSGSGSDGSICNLLIAACSTEW